MSSLVEEVPRGGNQFSGPGSRGAEGQLTSAPAPRGSRRSSSGRAGRRHRELLGRAAGLGDKAHRFRPRKQRKIFQALVLLIASNRINGERGRADADI